MGHGCGTLLWDTLVGHSCRTLLWDTHTGHSCRTLLWTCGTLLWDTHTGHSCGTLLWDTVAGHSCGTLLWDTLVGNSCGILLCDTLVGHSCRTLLWDTPVGHTLRTRLPPKVTLRGCKTSVLHETSSKSHASSLQNERFVRDFLQKSHVKSPKRAFRTRLPQKLTCQSPQNERFARDFLQKSSGNTHRSTHITQPCQAVSRFQPLQTTPAHTPIPMWQRHSALPQLTNLPIPCTCHESFRVHTSNAHKVLRLPRNVTSITPRNLTIPCACHENRSFSHARLKIARIWNHCGFLSDSSWCGCRWPTNGGRTSWWFTPWSTKLLFCIFGTTWEMIFLTLLRRTLSIPYSAFAKGTSCYLRNSTT